MSSALTVVAALANCGPDAPQEEFLQFLAHETPENPIFLHRPAPETIRASLDWQGVLGTGANLIAYAGALWAAYERFVRPRLKKKGKRQDAFLFVSVRRPDGEFAQFTLGRQFTGRDEFIDGFVNEISDLRSGDGPSESELLSEIGQREEWIRIDDRDAQHP